MVSRHLMFAFALLGAADLFAAAKLTTECEPQRIFPGQTTLCSFVLFASEPALEVEVAKFPEFRGYWIENLSLRQGPLALVPLSGRGAKFRTTIGSYALVPMVHRPSHSIEPMKLVVRIPGTNGESILYSEAPPQRIEKLPPIPKSLNGITFPGAVGRFQLLAEGPILSFQKDEPLTLRYLLVGDGNFHDIRIPDLPFPKYVEVLSNRSIVEGISPALRKTFEYSVVVHQLTPFALQPEPLLAFDPAIKSYQLVKFPGVRFVLSPKPVLERSAERGTVLDGIEKGPPHPYPLLTDTWLFWGLNGLLVLITAVGSATQLLKMRRERHESSLGFHLKLKYEIALEAYANGRIEDFLRMGEDIVASWLGTFAALPPGLSRLERLKRVSQKIDPVLLNRLNTLLQARDTLLYSPEKKLPVPIQTLHETMARLFEDSTSLQRKAS